MPMGNDRCRCLDASYTENIFLDQDHGCSCDNQLNAPRAWQILVDVDLEI